MKISYNTLAELNLFFPQGSDFALSVQEEAQVRSFEIVNSYISTKQELIIKKVYFNSNLSTYQRMPGVLKQAQASLYRYLLEMINSGYTDELQLLYDNTIKVLKELTDDQLGITFYYDSINNTGVVIYDSSVANGEIFIEGIATLELDYKITINNFGLYSITCISNNTSLANNVATHIGWITYFDTYNSFKIRFNGVFTNNEYVLFKAIPKKENSLPIVSDTIKFGNIII